MSLDTDDMFLSLLVNSKKIKNGNDFKYVDGLSCNEVNLNNTFQILEKNIKQSESVLTNLTSFNEYLSIRLPIIICEFEKIMVKKID